MDHQIPPAAPGTTPLAASDQPRVEVEDTSKKASRPIIPIGTLIISGVVMLTIIFLWMLVLGVQQGRA